MCQLLRCEEPENAHLVGSGVWVSAHPAIGEKLVSALIANGVFDDRLAAPSKGRADGQVTVQRRVSTSESGNYRPDFRVEHDDGSCTLLETKQVVDTDYAPETAVQAAQLQEPHIVYAREASSPGEVYERSGIFPWGKKGQSGPDGEKVVSARAIDHLRELTAVAERAAGTASTSGKTHAAVAFMVGRHDVTSVRPNGAACPSFARYVAEAEVAGVRVLAHMVRWGEGEDVGKGFDAGPVPLAAPMTPGDDVSSAGRGVPTPTKKKRPSLPK